MNEILISKIAGILQSFASNINTATQEYPLPDCCVLLRMDRDKNTVAIKGDNSELPFTVNMTIGFELLEENIPRIACTLAAYFTE